MWRLGRATSPSEIRDELKQLKLPADVLEAYDRTAQHLRDNDVDLEKTKLTLGPRLHLDADREAFVKHPQADALLSREYRKPFVVPAEKEL